MNKVDIVEDIVEWETQITPPLFTESFIYCLYLSQVIPLGGHQNIILICICLQRHFKFVLGK